MNSIYTRHSICGESGKWIHLISSCEADYIAAAAGKVRKEVQKLRNACAAIHMFESSVLQFFLLQEDHCVKIETDKT